MFAKVDDSDYRRVIEFGVWKVHEPHPGIFYASSGRTHMHHFVMGRKARFDHRNRDGLDNQKHNLRPATCRQNSANMSKCKTPSSSKYKGVYFDKQHQRYRARIFPNNKAVHLGLFKRERDAALAYDAAAKKIFGEFACLNLG